MANKNKTTPAPLGKLYSHVYGEVAPVSADSPRARARIGHYLNSRLETEVSNAFAAASRKQFGVGPTNRYTYDWHKFVVELPLSDFRDLITLIVNWRSEVEAVHKRTGITAREAACLRDLGAEWLPFCTSVFDEERLNYRIDEQGGVHPLIDEEFQIARRALLGALSTARYAGARDHFETAHRHLAQDPPETRQAIWSMFQCVETVFQLLVKGTLNRGNVENKLLEVVKLAFPNDDPKAWKKILDGVSDWSDAFHQYRHGQAEEKPRSASMQLCVYALSSGASIARLLADFDAKGIGLL